MLVRTAGLLALGLTLATTLPAPARAQTLFAWPDTTANVEAYATIEQCQAVVGRSIWSSRTDEWLASGIMLDTMPLDRRERRAPAPAPVGETARRCMERFAAVDSVPLSYFTALLQLYLHAGWDDAARALVERQLAAITADIDAAKNEKEAKAAEGRLVAAIDSASDISLGHGSALDLRPPRHEMARAIVMKYAPRVSNRVSRIGLYQSVLLLDGDLTQDGKLVDTARMARDGARIAALIDSLTERERSELHQMFGAPEDLDLVEAYTARLERSLGWHVLLDTLRRSTAKYDSLMRNAWARSWGMRPETYGFGNPLGERAPAIEADIWLGREDGGGPRPAPGRVSLIVFLDPAKCTGVVDGPDKMYGACARSLIPLRRLMKRFPALDVTVVAEANGFFMYLKDSVTLEREAELTKRWLESYGVTAPLAMSAPESWKLDSPDGRTIRSRTANERNYSFGRNGGVANSAAYLVDEDGIIVHTRQMNRHGVGEDYDVLVEILLERQVANR
jgi:hypothetical protein